MSVIVVGCVYALWLVAGSLDFHFHRRTDLPHTSAMRESLLHGVQLLLIGSGVLAWLVLESTWSLIALLAVWSSRTQSPATSTPSVRMGGDASARLNSTCTVCSTPLLGSCWAGWRGRLNLDGQSVWLRQHRRSGGSYCCRRLAWWCCHGYGSCASA